MQLRGFDGDLDVDYEDVNEEPQSEMISDELPMAEGIETPRVLVKAVTQRWGSANRRGALRLPWFRRFKRQVPARSVPQTPMSTTSSESPGHLTSTGEVQPLALPLWQTMLAGGLACVCHRAVAGSIEDLMRGHRQPAAVVAQNFLKFSKGGFPFGALCCSFYASASVRRPFVLNSDECQSVCHSLPLR